jgi:hypothetical protein
VTFYVIADDKLDEGADPMDARCYEVEVRKPFVGGGVWLATTRAQEGWNRRDKWTLSPYYSEAVLIATKRALDLVDRLNREFVAKVIADNIPATLTPSEDVDAIMDAAVWVGK